MRISFAGSPENRAIAKEAARWSSERLMSRLWKKDPTVWSKQPVPELADRLGWLTLPTSAARHIDQIQALRREALAEGVRHIVLCGMGGSSLAAEVFAQSLPREPGHPSLIVLDSTHPDKVVAATDSIEVPETWFIIASKSGGTLETLSFMRYFWEKASSITDTPGDRFIAITDPGSDLEQLASARDFRATFLADPEVGGRYSALSAFGLVPAGLIGCDVSAVLAAGSAAAALCGPETPLERNPGFAIGVTMAMGVQAAKDKVRFVGSEHGGHFGMWAEQLIAESTGKAGTGIVPVDGGPVRPDASDELVISVGTRDDSIVADVDVELASAAELASAMFIMEMATAVAGAQLGIHPFNQPDVQRAKLLANEAMDGKLADVAEATSIRSPDLHTVVNSALSLEQVSYVSIQAYLAPTGAIDSALEQLQFAVVGQTGAATTVGYGPRFLHSTGQLHKGGPSGCIFFQLVDTPHNEVPIPETALTFNALIAAQAAGDRLALTHADRTVISVSLGADPEAGLAGLTNIVRSVAP
ncbi:MAG: glucose-6-phosphate isomerase [Actinomycetota bacterium]|nr:glucose-6-phosphate isomerase [Actinomycetota bacterium]